MLCYANKVSLISDRAQTHSPRFVAHAWKMRGMRFQEYPSNGSGYTDENILRSPTKHYSPIATTLMEFVAHASRIRSIKNEENRYNGSRDTAERVLRSPNEVPSFIDRSQPKLNRITACVENELYEVSGKSHQWKPRYGRKCTAFSSNFPFIADRSQPHLQSCSAFVEYSKYGVKETPYNGSRDAANEVGRRPHILLITVNRRITLEDGPDKLSLNVGNKLPISAAKRPRTARISHCGRCLISRNPMSITDTLFNGIKSFFIGILNPLDFLILTIKCKITAVHVKRERQEAENTWKPLHRAQATNAKNASHETKLTLVMTSTPEK